MKRSKIFLGLTTAILAVVGVAAAKRYTQTVRFYITSNSTWCTQVASPCIKSSDPSAVQCNYTPCLVSFPLYTQGNSGTLPDATRCKSALKYLEQEAH